MSALGALLTHGNANYPVTRAPGFRTHRCRPIRRGYVRPCELGRLPAIPQGVGKLASDFPVLPCLHGRAQAGENHPSPGERRRGRQDGVSQARSRNQRQAARLRVRQRRGNVGAISRVRGTRRLSKKCVAVLSVQSQLVSSDGLGAIVSLQATSARPAQPGVELRNGCQTRPSGQAFRAFRADQRRKPAV